MLVDEFDAKVDVTQTSTIQWDRWIGVPTSERRPITPKEFVAVANTPEFVEWLHTSLSSLEGIPELTDLKGEHFWNWIDEMGYGSAHCLVIGPVTGAVSTAKGQTNALLKLRQILQENHHKLPAELREWEYGWRRYYPVNDEGERVGHHFFGIFKAKAVRDRQRSRELSAKRQQEARVAAKTRPAPKPKFDPKKYPLKRQLSIAEKASISIRPEYLQKYMKVLMPAIKIAGEANEVDELAAEISSRGANPATWSYLLVEHDLKLAMGLLQAYGGRCLISPLELADAVGNCDSLISYIHADYMGSLPHSNISGLLQNLSQRMAPEAWLRFTFSVNRGSGRVSMHVVNQTYSAMWNIVMEHPELRDALQEYALDHAHDSAFCMYMMAMSELVVNYTKQAELGPRDKAPMLNPVDNGYHRYQNHVTCWFGYQEEGVYVRDLGEAIKRSVSTFVRTITKDEDETSEDVDAR